MFYYYGYYYILIPAILLSMWASFKVNSNYTKYARIPNSMGITGGECARRLLQANGIYDVYIEVVGGKLTDHYDPSNKVVRLSNQVYHDDSIASVSIASHELGHVLQHEKGYAPLAIRNAIVPVVNLSTSLSWILIILGIVMSFSILINIGILLFSACVVFQLITLPVELNASKRAIAMLKDNGIVNSGEVVGSKKVLSAAAMTYVAALLTSILQLVRLMMIAGDRN